MTHSSAAAQTPSARGRMRPIVLAAALLASVLTAGCDDDVQTSGVGASVGLPNAFSNGATNTPDIGVGNVHWVGNPRW